MSKRKRLLLLIALLVVGCIAFYKWKQASFLGLSDPQVETPKSIMDYANTHGLHGEVFVPKDAEAHATLNEYFGWGQIYVFDKDLQLIDCNLESLGGQCFQDVSDDICAGMALEHRTLSDKISGSRVYDLIMAQATPLTPIGTVAPTYTIVYPWVMYAKACVDPNSLQFITCIQGRPDVRRVLLNLDEQSF